MSAGLFVGRVGGLAVALGIGVACHSGAGIAWADNGSGSGSGEDTSASQPSRPTTHPARGGVSQGAARRPSPMRRAVPVTAAAVV